MMALLLPMTGLAAELRPSGPPPGGRVLPEADPVIPPGCVAPTLATTLGKVVAESAIGGWLEEPSPPLRDANGTYHMYATQRKAGTTGSSMVGAEIVHFQTASLELPWTGGEVVLSPSKKVSWDSAGVFSPGAAFNAVNGTWSLYYSGVSSSSSAAWLGLASSDMPSGRFSRVAGGRAAVRGERALVHR